ncbi:MAG: WecB/TagA/CpsF family glycosyltransferase, partial [Candidatus Moraniibacteriota bacterium]
MQIEILGVPVSVDGRGRVLEKVGSYLREARFHRIATVNPEFLVLACQNNLFRENLRAADLRIADGFGMVLAGLLQGEEVPRFPGVDLLYDILSLAEKDGYPVFLAIRKDGLSSYEEIRQALLKKYPHLSISGLDMTIGDLKNYQLPATTYRLILCNFGAPDQELFLEGLRNTQGDIRLAMGVGGSFDYLTGKQKRAPKCLRAIGLEWLWRLILQPWR